MHCRSYDVSDLRADTYPIGGHENNNGSKSGQNFGRLSWKTKIFFSFGHIYNDLCASIWFSYTLIFFQMHFRGTIAGTLLLLGQVADALATPFIGFQSDKNNTNQWLCRYGRRKTWHLLGTVLVSVSFPFIFNKCFDCEESTEIVQVIYYGAFIVLFQFGWAAVQVGHVSLITDLSSNSKERVELNSYRQASTVASSICVYTITWFILSQKGNSSIRKDDADIFTLVVYIVCGIGIVFSILFHLFVNEPEPQAPDDPSTPNDSLCGSECDLVKNNYRKRLCSNASVYEKNVQKQCRKSFDISSNISFSYSSAEKANINDIQSYKWSDWLKDINFYKVAFIYMVSRLFVNLTQVYTPLFLQKTLHLRKTSIAIIPFVTYISGFVWSLISRFISAKTGPKILLLIGCAFGLGSCFWNFFGSIDNESFKSWEVYGSAFLFGIGGTTMLIASLALTSDLIGMNTTSSAFVFGTMSFFDKVLNGVMVVVLEQLNPYKNSPEEEVEANEISIPFYKTIVVFVSGATALLTVLSVTTVIKTKFLSNNKQTTIESNDNNSVTEVKTKY